MSLIKGLGYVTVAASDIDRWRHFAFDVLGFAHGKGGSDASALYLRMDERAARIIVVPGDVDKKSSRSDGKCVTTSHSKSSWRDWMPPVCPSSD